jgi:hypothetical protein
MSPEDSREITVPSMNNANGSQMRGVRSFSPEGQQGGEGQSQKNLRDRDSQQDPHRRTERQPARGSQQYGLSRVHFQ